MLPSATDIVAAARKQLTFLPSRPEVLEARSFYTERHPECLDAEDCQMKGGTPNAQSEKSTHCDACRRTLEFGAYTMTVEGSLTHKIENVVQFK